MCFIEYLLLHDVSDITLRDGTMCFIYKDWKVDIYFVH